MCCDCRHHGHHQCHCKCGCDCCCCCCCEQEGSAFRRRYYSKKEQREWLEEYRDELKRELEAVEEELAALK